MIPFLKLAWTFRRQIGYVLAALVLITAFLWYRHSLIQTGMEQGREQIRALWKADTAARDKAASDAIQSAREREEAARKANEARLADANSQLVTIAGERDSVERLLQSARGQIRGLAASQASGERGIDVLTGIAARAAEVDRRLADYDRACRADAVRFSALQEQIRGQL